MFVPLLFLIFYFIFRKKNLVQITFLHVESKVLRNTLLQFFETCRLLVVHDEKMQG